MIILVIGEMDAVPAFRLPVPFHFLLSVCLPSFVALVVIGIRDDAVKSLIAFCFGLPHLYLFPDLPAQAVVAVQRLLPLAVHFPGYLSMPVVLIGMQYIPVRVTHFCQASAAVIGIAVARAVIYSSVIGFGLYLFYHISVRVIKPPFHAAVRVTDADAFSVRAILIAGSLALVPLQGITHRMDSVCDVPVKVPEYPLMLLQGGYDIHHSLQKVAAVLIAALFLLPLHGRVVSRQVAHAVVELTGNISLPVRAAGDKVSGVVRHLHRAVGVADRHSAAHGVITVVGLLPLGRGDPAGVGAVCLVFLESLVPQGVPLQDAPSHGIVLLCGLPPLCIIDLLPGQDPVMGIVIDIPGLPAVRIPGAHKVVVFIIRMARFVAVRGFFPDGASVGVILPLFPVAQAADLAGL